MTRPWTPGQPVPHVHNNVPEMLREVGMSDDAISALIDFDVANFQWYRTAAKGEMMTAILRRLGQEIDVAHFQGLTAMIRIQCGVGRAPTEPTIGLVAEEMSVDPSRASRIVSDLVARGYVSRGVAQDDARRSVLAPTEAGKAMLDAFRAEKWHILAQVFADWPAEDIQRFARSIRGYTEGVQAALAGMAAADRAAE